MAGGERLDRFEYEPIIAFELSANEEKEFVARNGIVLKDRETNRAHLHQVVHIKGSTSVYEAEVAALNKASSGDETKRNFVVELIRKLRQ